jgi:PPM family protein phosphatase
MVINVTIYAKSDVGLVRKKNEDSWNYLTDPYFYVLADGMGGHQAGEVASQTAVSDMCELVKREWHSQEYSLPQVRDFLKDIVQRVNLKVYQLSLSENQYYGMGTTLCALLLHPKGAVYAHVGDSRIYRFRDNQIEQLTEDHSWIKELKTGYQNSLSAYKHVLSRAIGIDSKVEPTVSISPLFEDDLFLICSDGLTDRLANEDLLEVLRETPLDQVAGRLIDLANLKGGQDNITVMLVKVNESHLS